MNFVAQLEDHLRDLGAEARKNHPGVKEASERAILKLRSLQNTYAGAVREASASAGKQPSTSMFRSSDLLHPFLLAANYPNASPKLLDTSFKAMKLLMEADAICPGDGMNLVRVWMIQAQVVVSYSTKDSSSGNLSAIADSNSTMSLSSVESESSSGADDASSARSGASNTGSSSWFGSLLSSSESATKSLATAVAIKTGVSSSHGQAGSGHLSAKDLEKLALDILRCLLQLLELKDLPVSKEQWIQSVTLCCLLCLPSKQTVRQAAHSTLPQVLTLLVKSESVQDLALATWEDLLSCSTRSQPRKRPLLRGAFANCRPGEKNAAQPPSPSMSLELMATLLKEATSVFKPVGKQTIEALVVALQNDAAYLGNTPSEFLRLMQCVIVVLQTQSKELPEECGKLVSSLLGPIATASDSLRKHVDFEDGFVYKIHDPSLTPSTAALATLRSLPPTLLWKVALCLDELKTIVCEKSLRQIFAAEDIMLRTLETISDFCTIGASCQDHMNLLVLACRQKDHSLSYEAEALTSISSWKEGKTNQDTYVLGHALLLGLKSMLKLVDFMKEATMEEGFAPSVAILQHYLKRFPASGTIIEMALEGYFSLAQLSIKRPIIRQALLASLCRLSLPQWGSGEQSSMLRDHNIAIVICLLNVVHRFYNEIDTDWAVVLQTFQELSALPIASPHLSDNAYVGALSISAVFSRLTSFSTCLSDSALQAFVEALGEVSRLDSTERLMTSPSNLSESSLPMEQGQSKDEKDTISRTIMNIGVRAIYGANDSGNQKQDDVPLTERTKSSYAQDFQFEFSRRVNDSKYPVRLTEASFGTCLLVDIAMANSYRAGECHPTLYRQLCQLACQDSSVRNFVLDAMAMLVVSRISNDKDLPALTQTPGVIVHEDPRQNQYLATEPRTSDTLNVMEVSQSMLLEPLCDCIKSAETASIAEAGVEALHIILESCGHKLDEAAWTTVIDSIQSLPSPERASEEWSSSCLVGFRCLKLIIDDFVDQADSSSSTRIAMLDCCAAFGSSLHDVNTSLTAVGFIWSIADQDAGSVSVNSALEKLVALTADGRSEVRDCAVNTFFSCLVGRGQSLSDQQWRICLEEMVISIFETVSSSKNSIDEEDMPKSQSRTRRSRYQVSIHHSRDSAGKQWISTQALILRGLSRVLRHFFPKLLSTTEDASAESETPWFDGVWSRILGYSFESSTQSGGRDTLDLRVAGVELLVLCSQLACTSGVEAAIAPARVGTSMEVVNGALRNVRSPQKGSSERPLMEVESRSDVAEMWRENLFLDAFDVLDSFREHLETTGEAESQPASDPTHAQVLNTFAAEMGKLYNCCKTHELAEKSDLKGIDIYAKLLQLPRELADENDPLVLRFVEVLTTVLKLSGSSPNARHLSQPQRSCLEVFRTMASNGSPTAFLVLTHLSGLSFFVNPDKKQDPKAAIDIVGNEATTILMDGCQNENTSDLTRVLISSRMLSVFLQKVAQSKSSLSSFSYSSLANLLELGLGSSKGVVQSTADDTSTAEPNYVDDLWNHCVETLEIVLPHKQPYKESMAPKHAQDLIAIIHATASHVPPELRDTFSPKLSTVLSSAMSPSLKKASYQQSDWESWLELFEALFKGVCRLEPKKQDLKTLASEVFTVTLKVLNEHTEEDLFAHTEIRACLKICTALETVQGASPVAIAVFSELCQLVGVEQAEIRAAVGRVLAGMDVAGVVAEAEALRLAAEERAVLAEIQVFELQKQVERLTEEKEFLYNQRAQL